MFDDVDERRKRRRRRKTKTASIEKEQKKVKKKVFKTNALVPKTNSMRKEEGATVAATPTFPHSGPLRCFVRPFRAVNREIQTIGKDS
jgi:hypothetical protein